ncbi:transmembrane protein [Anaeramoeba flamelloides]|uniref:Transmembrane protein n=1 Tax=Anaeramoeba flamelloides TaxID=1746091 RepID=A0ABQ8YY29_9EUKA|nr:transmembrane protein [Anaeramoeba flamelloides]
MEENNNKLIYKFEFWCESNNILNSLGFFFGLFLFSLAVGGFGPSSLNSKTESFHIENNTDTSDNTFIITGLTKLNQFLFVSAYFHNTRDYGIFSEVGYETRLFGSNNLNKNHQSTIANWKQITSSNHSRTIECKFTSSSLEFLLIYTLDTGYVLFLAVAFLPINITINFRKNTNDQLKQEEGRHKPLNQDSKNRSESGYGLENNQIGIINEKRDHSKKPIGDGEISSEIEPSDLEYGNGNHEKNRKLKKEEFIVKKDSENEEIEKGGLLSSENSEN